MSEILDEESESTASNGDLMSLNESRADPRSQGSDLRHRASQVGRRVKESERGQKIASAARKVASDERTKTVLKGVGIAALTVVARKGTRRVRASDLLAGVVEELSKAETAGAEAGADGAPATNALSQQRASESGSEAALSIGTGKASSLQGPLQPLPSAQSVNSSKGAVNRKFSADVSKLFVVSLAEIMPLHDLWQISRLAVTAQNQTADVPDVSVKFWSLLNISDHPAARSARRLLVARGCRLGIAGDSPTLAGQAVRIELMSPVDTSHDVLRSDSVRLLVEGGTRSGAGT